jgi:hypothetical protein
MSRRACALVALLLALTSCAHAEMCAKAFVRAAQPGVACAAARALTAR